MTVLLAQEDVAETKSNLQIDTTPIVEPAITKTEREHWSFLPIVRHSQPATKNAAWLRTPIDAFILAPIEAKNLHPASEAPRATLLRRLSFDLLGLPPTPEELASFSPEPNATANQPPDAYERQLDRYLASPAFGERYAQYWLDLARFAESDGYEFDTVRPHAWRYRDWVIAALNADMPYDEFIRHQLASDEIAATQSAIRNPQSAIEPDSATPNAKSKKPTAPPPTLAQIPTMFCLAGPDMPDVNDQIERRHSMMNELASTVGSALLGLQLGCAQCHNHKYDPISQADFYRLRAVFEPAVPAYKRDVPVNVLANQKEIVPARFWIRGDHRRPGLEVPPAFPRIASSTPALSTPALSTPALSTPTRSASEGNVDQVANTQARSASKGNPAPTRTELATWLTAPENPLTARVIANRVWQWHFGRGLQQTPSDFGVMGGALTHPQLLDYLASELRDEGWSLKKLHRTILTSSVYRQSSNPQSAIPNPQSVDPDNELLAHFPRQRQTGEAIRDALLESAGLLTSERGGPGVMPPLPEELLGTLLKGQWSTSKREADHYKRSVYVFARRNLRLPLFEAFDRPDGNASCPSRTRSTTAPQSLLLLNSELSLLAARHLAGRILADDAQASTSREQIERLYQITLSRQPTIEESTRIGEFLTKQSQRLAKESRDPKDLALPSPFPTAADPYQAAALVDACLAILNSNEFIYVD